MPRRVYPPTLVPFSDVSLVAALQRMSTSYRRRHPRAHPPGPVALHRLFRPAPPRSSAGEPSRGPVSTPSLDDRRLTRGHLLYIVHRHSCTATAEPRESTGDHVRDRRRLRFVEGEGNDGTPDCFDLSIGFFTYSFFGVNTTISNSEVRTFAYATVRRGGFSREGLRQPLLDT